YIPLRGSDVFNGRVNQDIHDNLNDRLDDVYSPIRTMDESHINDRMIVKIETLEYAVGLFKRIFSNGERFAEIVDLLYHQHHLYRSHRFSECLVGTWAVIEVSIHKKWREY